MTLDNTILMTGGKLCINHEDSLWNAYIHKEVDDSGRGERGVLAAFLLSPATPLEIKHEANKNFREF